MTADLPIPAIRALIADQLPVRYPKVEQIACRLGVPVRTLQRRLARAGLTYSGMVEETRLFLARRLLAQPDAHVAGVAKLLGYRDPSSFSRAFRRWTGDPPRAFCQHATSSKSMPGQRATEWPVACGPCPRLLWPGFLPVAKWPESRIAKPYSEQALAIPAATRRDISEEEKSMSLPGKTMKIGGWNYHVSDQGDGDKVAFLVHGMPDDGSCWKYQAPALLKAGYRVIVPDTLGYGKTDRPVEVEHYKVEKIIEHMFEIIDTLGLKDIHLMGHDWGSAITWPMVLERPELFRKFISMSVGHLRCVFGQAHETPERMYECLKANWYMYMHCLNGVEELYMANDFRFFRSFFCQHPEAETVIDLIKETGRIEWLNYDKANHVPMDYLAQAKDPNSLPNCKVPTMVIFPEDDMFLWKTQAIDTPRYMDAECRIEIIQGGHWSMLDHPDDVNKLMVDWFDSEPSTARADVLEA